ncbi:MAG: hypothetical protein IJM51_04465 [Clostridia bacterium]|nr:hypothetical protein [Clostridia bacterium]
MISKSSKAVAFVIAALTLFIFSSCNFNTTVITSAEKPEKVIVAFFSSLKQKNYNDCDKLFFDKFTIQVTTSSGKSFTDKLVNCYIDNLDYELVGESEISGINAKQKMKITTFSKAAFFEWLKKNKTKIERNYLTEMKITEVDRQNTEAMCDLLLYAIDHYSENISLTTSEIEVSFRFRNNKWLIVGDQNLVEAIYGGISDEQ